MNPALAAAEAAAKIHQRLQRDDPSYDPTTPLASWGNVIDPTVELKPGTVLRAIEGDPEDPYYEVVVVGTQRTWRDEPNEYVIRPAHEFGPMICAPLFGEGGLRTIYDVTMDTPERVRAAAEARKFDALSARLDALRTEEDK